MRHIRSTVHTTCCGGRRCLSVHNGTGRNRKEAFQGWVDDD